MKRKIGFIGCGKMAGAIIEGIKDEGYIISGSEYSQESALNAQNRLGIDVITDNIELVKISDVVFIATKPNQVTGVLSQIKDVITSEKLIVSIAAGVTTEKIESLLTNVGIVRVMPNTPALVKSGMFGICGGKYATEADVDFVSTLLSSIGKCIIVNEDQMDVVTAISGSGPAFFYQVIEDMARAGEKLGLDYEKSLVLATQTAIGSAQMIFNRGEVPVQDLIDNVATKGGCTFVGIEEMKKYDSSKIFFDVIDKTAKKANELGK